MTRYYLLTGIFLILLTGCETTEKDENGNVTSSGVAETSTGANTMGAVIDQKEAWQAGVQVGIPISVPIAKIQGTRTGNLLSLVATRTNFNFTTLKPEVSVISINVYADKPGTYTFGVKTDGATLNTAFATYFEVTGSFDWENGTAYWTDGQEYTGTLTLKTLNLTDKIAAGTFSFKAVAKDDKLAVTGTKNLTYGVFDVKFN